jgi:CheY-like chemotaxis protein
MNPRRPRILLLDSDERNLIELQGELEDSGFDTTITWDGAEALQWLRARPFEILLIGDHPPELTASEILHEVQCSRMRVQCVILQRQRRPQPLPSDHFLSLGAQGVIESTSPAEVAQLLQELLVPQGATARA